ncbi:hypothetical protein ACSYGW_04140 [Bacillus glycinifermentans]|uniref:hypothetical protein n=1 Tax=Bacillus glycinifermentans TaxID=1664069 RepID=UPI00405864ED
MKIPDDIEAAEFYFKVSWLYMSLRQNAVSLNYAKDAMNIYKMYDGYKKKLAISQVVMGTNYMQMQRFKALKTQRNTSRNRLKFQRRLAIHF